MAAIVRAGGNRPDLVAQVTAYLVHRVRNLNQEQVDALVDRVVTSIVEHGGDVASNVQQAVVGYAHELGTNVGRILERGEQVATIATGIAGDIAGTRRGNRDWSGAIIDPRPEGTVDVDFEGEHDIIENDEDLPDLEDLDPMDGSRSGSGSGRNDGSGSGSEEVALRASAGGGPASVSKETPISQYPSLSYGLPETHTTILPWTGWLTVAKVASGTNWTPQQLKIRMNTPYDMLDVAVALDPGDGSAFTGDAFYAVPSSASGGQVAGMRYPERFTSNSTEATEKPAWRDYWAQIYDYYTVLGCEYEIVLFNPLSSDNKNMRCAVQFDTYSDTATSTGNVMPLTKYSEILTYKNIKWYTVYANTTKEDQKGNQTVIRGTYKPGQAKRNIVNDGDVKTWTATSTTLPNLKEILTLNFFQDPLWPDSGVTVCNMQITLKYIVQFKDLKQQARYPNTITTNQDLIQTLNETNTAQGSALQRWA